MGGAALQMSRIMAVLIVRAQEALEEFGSWVLDLGGTRRLLSERWVMDTPSHNIRKRMISCARPASHLAHGAREAAGLKESRMELRRSAVTGIKVVVMSGSTAYVKQINDVIKYEELEVFETFENGDHCF